MAGELRVNVHADGARKASRASTVAFDNPDVTDGGAPCRTCVGCRQTDSRSSLLRVVLDSSGTTLVLDESKSMAGRGAWLHVSAECLSKATMRKAWGRALKVRQSVNADGLHRALRERFPLTTSLDGGTEQEAQHVSSHDHDRKRV